MKDLRQFFNTMELLIFGGFSKAQPTNMVCNMLESEGGLVLRKVPDNKPGCLAAPDIFIYNGVNRLDEET